jgi:hypothetical protein
MPPSSSTENHSSFIYPTVRPSFKPFVPPFTHPSSYNNAFFSPLHFIFKGEILASCIIYRDFLEKVCSFVPWVSGCTCLQGRTETWSVFSSMWDLRFSQRWLGRLLSSGMLRHVALVKTDISEELSASIIRVTRIGELGTTLAVTSNWCMLQRNTKCYG